MTRFILSTLIAATLATATAGPSFADSRKLGNTSLSTVGPSQIIAPNNRITPPSRPGKPVRCGAFTLCNDMPEEEEIMMIIRRNR